jgi:hypothetical protein
LKLSTENGNPNGQSAVTYMTENGTETFRFFSPIFSVQSDMMSDTPILRPEYPRVLDGVEKLITEKIGTMITRHGTVILHPSCFSRMDSDRK